MVSAKGITADGRRDLILGYASPGIEPQHSVSFFGFGLKPLEFSVACIIVVFGWAVYPIGYFLGYLTGGNPADSMGTLSIVYNFADLINKIGFGVIIWNVAVTASESNT
jgi:hypothetical protein